MDLKVRMRLLTLSYHPPEIVGSVQLKKYREFLQEFATNIMDIEDAFDENLSESWDFAMDPIILDVRDIKSFIFPLTHVFQLNPRENITVLDLVKTENKVCSNIWD